jgi:hypothetical protein
MGSKVLTNLPFQPIPINCTAVFFGNGDPESVSIGSAACVGKNKLPVGYGFSMSFYSVVFVSFPYSVRFSKPPVDVILLFWC